MGAEVEFELHTPADAETLKSHVEHAIALDYHHLGYIAQRSGPLTIIANGPSALNAPLHGPTLALNGALDLWFNTNRSPTYWAACDPQKCVADFLDYAPSGTTYLVASKCHPKVFEKLQGKKVIVWHVNDECTWEQTEPFDPISSAVSITICALELGERLGFSRFETWGWDGCYIDGRDHASSQPHNLELMFNQVGSRNFPTTRAWALEGQDARTKFIQTPRDIQIHGDGMFRAQFEYWGFLPERQAA